jgi:hypothetical protein
VIEDGGELGVVDQEFAEREPALAALARAAVNGLSPAGPETPRPAAPRVPGVEVTAPLSVSELGFSLHAATAVRAGGASGREALVKYVLRPPIAQERLRLLDDGLCASSCAGRFATAPPPSISIRSRCSAGWLRRCRRRGCTPCVSPVCSRRRTSGVRWWDPRVSPAEIADDEPAHEQPEPPATHRCHYWPWARLLKRSLGVDGEKCDACGARMKLRAIVFAARSIERLLAHLCEPTEPPPLSPARGPPFFKSHAVSA